MCYEVEQFTTESGKKPVLDFILEQDRETQDLIFSGIEQLEIRKGIIQNQNLETKHVKDKIFELKFKKLAVRILYAYHPGKRRFLLLLHGVIKKRDKLKASDIEVAAERYKIMLNSYY